MHSSLHSTKRDKMEVLENNKQSPDDHVAPKQALNRAFKDILIELQRFACRPEFSLFMYMVGYFCFFFFFFFFLL